MTATTSVQNKASVLSFIVVTISVTRITVIREHRGKYEKFVIRLLFGTYPFPQKAGNI